MKGTITRLIAILQGANKRLIIPYTHRNYEWGWRDCQQLYGDVINLVQNPDQTHFMGTVIVQFDPEGNGEAYTVIDGQQRLITLSLFLLALETQALKSTNSTATAREIANHIVDEWSPTQPKIKISDKKDDQDDYERLINDVKKCSGESKFIDNYHWFISKVSNERYPAEKIYEALQRLTVVQVILSENDRVGAIYDRLNATGKRLSEDERIRTYLFSLSADEYGRRDSERYWNDIESAVGEELIDFFGAYIQATSGFSPYPWQLSSTFIQKAEREISGDDSWKELFQKVRDYAVCYRVQKDASADDDQIGSALFRLNWLEARETAPFVLNVLYLFYNKKITTETVRIVLRATETYYFRKVVCNDAPLALGNLFLEMHKKIIGLDGTCSYYAPKYIYLLDRLRGEQSFPSDSDFTLALANRAVYKLRSCTRTYLLERLENYGTVEDKEVYRHLENGDYTVEHIMPQGISDEWAKELGPNWSQVHKDWAHKLANLTLTGYNQQYSNSTFREKRDMQNGLAQSGLRLNHWIAMQDKWNAEVMRLRTRLLCSMALGVWALPHTNYRPGKGNAERIRVDFAKAPPIPSECSAFVKPAVPPAASIIPKPEEEAPQPKHEEPAKTVDDKEPPTADTDSQPNEDTAPEEILNPTPFKPEEKPQNTPLSASEKAPDHSPPADSPPPATSRRKKTLNPSITPKMKDMFFTIDGSVKTASLVMDEQEAEDDDFDCDWAEVTREADVTEDDWESLFGKPGKIGCEPDAGSSDDLDHGMGCESPSDTEETDKDGCGGNAEKDSLTDEETADGEENVHPKVIVDMPETDITFLPEETVAAHKKDDDTESAEQEELPKQKKEPCSVSEIIDSIADCGELNVDSLLTIMPEEPEEPPPEDPPAVQPEDNGNKNIYTFCINTSTNLVGCKVVGLEYNGKKYNVYSWKALTAKVLRLLHEETPSVIAGPKSLKKMTLTCKYVRIGPDRAGKFDYVCDNIYVDPKIATPHRINLIRELLSLHGKKMTSLRISVKVPSDKVMSVIFSDRGKGPRSQAGKPRKWG